jgi:ceramide glucosyltransferase
MLVSLSLALLALAAVGLVALALQLALTLSFWRSGAESSAAPAHAPGISVLKPLCGADDALAENLASFAALDYPDYEVVLGVRSAADPAYPLARAAVARWPERFRLALQVGEPGLNPKVNQLVTLADAARHDLLVVSDSNVRVEPGYLREVARAFADPEVGCLTHPVVGVGERRLGSLMDNLHLTASVAPGMVAAKQLVDRDIVVGKSMALRRSDLDQVGGFFSAKDLLAEDYVIGTWVSRKLGKRVQVASSPVFNVSQDKGVGAFYRRYQRWSVLQRTVVAPSTYLAQALLNPAPLALLAVLLSPTSHTLAAVAGIVGLKVALDLALLHALRGTRPPLAAGPAVLLKDLLLFGAWVHAGLRQTVCWRGTRLHVLSGSRLVRPAPLAPQHALPEPLPAEELLPL